MMIVKASRAVKPADDSVPWPLVWLLARFSRKHVFVGRRLPDLSHYRQAIVAREKKVRWHWFFRAGTSGPASVRLRGPTASFPGLADPALEALLGRVRSAILGAIKSKIVSARTHRSWSRMLPLTRLAFRCIRQPGFCIFPNDKEFRYSLMTSHDAVAAHAEVLRRPCYSETQFDHVATQWLHKKYRELCRDIQTVTGEERLATTLRRSMVCPRASLFAKLSITVKMHKAAGSVGFRNCLVPRVCWCECMAGCGAQRATAASTVHCLWH